MTTYSTTYVYLLDQNGNSSNGKVDELVENSVASATETGMGGTVDDGIVSVGEEFDVVFSNGATDALFGGTYTYIGHATPFSGFIAEDENGEFFLFTNNAISIGTTLHGFVAEDIPVAIFPAATVSVYTDDTLTTLVTTYDGVSAFSDALADALTGQVIAVDDPGIFGDAGAHSVTVDDLTIIANRPFDAALQLDGDAHDLTLEGTSDIDVVANADGGTIEGNDGANVLTGGAGNDALTGGGDALSLGDSLQGGAGDDDLVVRAVDGLFVGTLEGGIGTDELLVQGNVDLRSATAVADLEIVRFDTVAGTTGLVRFLDTQVAGLTDYQGRAGEVDRVAIDLTAGGTHDFSGLTSTEVESFTFRGSAGVDDITGTSIGDFLYNGGAGDTLRGGAGDDIYVLDTTDVSIVEASGGGTADTVKASVAFSLNANAAGQDIENITLLDAGNVSAEGNGLDNTMKGNAGNNQMAGLAGIDRIAGGDGDDRLDGGAGVDRLDGGAGSDTYVLTNLEADRDKIADFTAGTDFFEVSESLFAADFGTGTLAADQFRSNSTGKAEDANDHFIYNITNGGLYFDADGSGTGSARVLVATLVNAPAGLAETDFLLA